MNDDRLVEAALTSLQCALVCGRAQRRTYGVIDVAVLLQVCISDDLPLELGAEWADTTNPAAPQFRIQVARSPRIELLRREVLACDTVDGGVVNLEEAGLFSLLVSTDMNNGAHEPYISDLRIAHILTK